MTSGHMSASCSDDVKIVFEGAKEGDMVLSVHSDSLFERDLCVLNLICGHLTVYSEISAILNIKSMPFH